jgi:hypothetical protein
MYNVKYLPANLSLITLLVSLSPKKGGERVLLTGIHKL